MPEHLTPDDLRNISRANALLSRNKVSGKWREVSVSADDAGLKAFIENTGEYGAQFEFVTNESVSISNHIIPLGMTKYTLFQAFLNPNKPVELLPDALFAMTLTPGKNASFEVELVESAEHNGDDRRSPTADLLKTYAGRWIAQDGPSVILDGDTPVSVIAQLRRSGTVATVWRVPGTQIEAEAVDFFAK